MLPFRICRVVPRHAGLPFLKMQAGIPRFVGLHCKPALQARTTSLHYIHAPHGRRVPHTHPLHASPNELPYQWLSNSFRTHQEVPHEKHHNRARTNRYPG